MSDGDKVVKGETPSKEAEAYAASLRIIFDPKAALDRMDTYGKWLFTSAAIIGALGAGFSNSSFSRLRGPSVELFAIAILAMGGCLIAASLSVAPHWIKAKIDEAASMQNAIVGQFKSRQRELRWAAVLFGIALLLAASCPLFSLFAANDIPVAHFAVDEKGAVEIGVEATGQREGTLVELRLEANPNSGTVLPKAETTVDHDGQAKLGLRFSSYSSLPANSSIVLCLRAAAQGTCTNQERLIVKP